MDDFVNLILQHNPRYRKKRPRICAIAHNFSGFDGQFVMKTALDRYDTEMSVIMRGSKILKLNLLNKVTFIDSLNFLPMALAKFPTAFGLEDLQKGFYPHLFNTVDNYNYSGPIPARKFFMTDNMSHGTLKDFDKWYSEMQKNTNFIYNNRDELLKYCGDDVRILREGCTKFMLDFLSCVHVNPFLEAFTIAGAVLKVFTKNFMPEKSLAVLPRRGDTQSFIGSLWLIEEDEKNSAPRIQREFLLKEKILVDGYDQQTNTVYEFLGCWFHACPKCYRNRNVTSNTSSINLSYRYDQTVARLDKIRNAGYNLVHIWECNYRKHLKENPALKQKLIDTPEMLFGKLEPRAALYGGRVDVFKTYYRCKPNERIRYVDFCSLYPYVNMYGKYPLGHPIEHVKGIDQCQPYIEKIHNIDGFILCKILPPCDLYVPVLPLRCSSRLIFSLCRMCAESLNVFECTHNDNERALIGNWALCEVSLAVRKGYKICEIYELMTFNMSQYNPNIRKDGIFSEYMRTFLKLKQESSGWPEHCTDDISKERYLNEFYAAEGIQLDPLSIEKNPSKRNLAKLCANSLWGKLVQKPVHQGVEIFSELDQFYEFVDNEGVDLINVIACEDKVLVSWKYHNTDDTALTGQSNCESLTTGVYTTAQARMKLYTELDQIDPDCLLYCDTDSVIFVERPDAQYTPTIGTCIGELTDEITDQYGPTAYVSEFVSTAPKTYAMKVNFEDDPIKSVEVVKCKGYVTNNRNSLSFAKIKSLLDGEVVNTENKSHIFRSKDFQVYSRPLIKKYDFTLNKRACIESAFSKNNHSHENSAYETKPYGFKHINETNNV